MEEAGGGDGGCDEAEGITGLGEVPVILFCREVSGTR